MLSRLSQDGLENLFSTVRFKTPLPRAREFRSTFRIIVLAQFSQPSRHGSYAVDDSQNLLFFLAEKKDLAKDCEGDVTEPLDDDLFELCEEEEDSLQYFAGYIAYALIHKHKLCRTCKSSLVDNNREVPELIALKCYVQHGRNPLKVPSHELVKLLRLCESLFRANETGLLESKCSIESLQKLLEKKADGYADFPMCHNVAEKAAKHFFLCRMRFALKQKNAQLLLKLQQSGKCGSKSVGMRILSQSVH